MAAALLVVAAAGAGSAAAAIRYVTPDGAGTACTQEAPCGIQTGVEQASVGDEVVIAAGEYTANPANGLIDFPASGSITVRGAVIGPGRPVMTDFGFLVRAGSVLCDVEIRDTPINFGLVVQDGRADRVLVRVGNTGAACQVESGGRVTNSVCSNTGGVGVTLAVGGVRNVTAISLLTAGVRFDAEQSAVNTVMRGGEIASDLFCSVLMTPVLTNDHFATSSPQCSLEEVTGRVMSGLEFRDDPADLRQAPESSTIDAGTAVGVEPGELDLNGNLRVVGGGPRHRRLRARPRTRGRPGRGRGDDHHGGGEAGGRDQRRADHCDLPLRHRA